MFDYFVTSTNFLTSKRYDPGSVILEWQIHAKISFLICISTTSFVGINPDIGIVSIDDFANIGKYLFFKPPHESERRFGTKISRPFPHVSSSLTLSFLRLASLRDGIILADYPDT